MKLVTLQLTQIWCVNYCNCCENAQNDTELSRWVSQHEWVSLRWKKTDLLSKRFCFSHDCEDFRVKITSLQISLGSRASGDASYTRRAVQTFAVKLHKMFCRLRSFTWLSLSMEGGHDGWIYIFRWTFRVLKIIRTQVGQWETTWANLAIRLTHDSSCGWMWSLSNTGLSPASRCVLPATLILVIFYQAATVTRTETKTHSLSQAWLEDSAEFNTLYSSQARQLVL